LSLLDFEAVLTVFRRLPRSTSGRDKADGIVEPVNSLVEGAAHFATGPTSESTEETFEAGECLEELVIDRPETGDIISTLDVREKDEEDSSDHDERGDVGEAAGS